MNRIPFDLKHYGTKNQNETLQGARVVVIVVMAAFAVFVFSVFTAWAVWVAAN